MVGQPLDGRLGTLGIFHQPDYLGQDGFAAHLGGLKIQRAIGVYSRAKYSFARHFFHGHTLAGEHGLVHR